MIAVYIVLGIILYLLIGSIMIGVVKIHNKGDAGYFPEMIVCFWWMCLIIIIFEKIFNFCNTLGNEVYYLHKKNEKITENVSANCNTQVVDIQSDKKDKNKNIKVI